MSSAIQVEQIPSLTALRRHIKKFEWNGRWFTRNDSMRDVFEGQCEYAATALSEILTGKDGNWSLRVRGWYSGAITAIERSDPRARFYSSLRVTKHAHSWVRLPDGTIVDPTWWQFTDDRPKICVFPTNDPRFELDENA